MTMTVEKCSSINIFSLLKEVKKQVNRDYPDTVSEELLKIVQEELSKFTINGQQFEYIAIDNYLGGYRWFFACPKCKNKASKLFLPPLSGEQKYLCKNCHKLKNQSALMGQNNIYKKVSRPLKRMKEIEDKIHRGHLKTDAIQKLLDEYDKLEKDLKGSPEFRLYSFKKKHDML